ncbi:3'(2'),5'-bisphosphate nucleotidase CysQ [Acidocella aquatica]|uniref:3'(2'),5'-bisphosphate nucleotidase CysQ n=1 Tax=Acidocella aquatica TaxID=1922313 RepID=A0ABQ6A5X0_9PROT|nr:3'(2'),5'-bisphosphate nucleotidase CysQ [Acidocella aquatica]GLR65519.1 3'(2'),5'-bisphosphate nucleotidase CysQ [Acidocella aquatica]
MNDKRLLDLAVSLTAQAAAKILEVRDAGFTVNAKSDETPVTVADTQAEAIIVAGLRAAAPHIPVIAEEEVAAGRITAPTSQYWLVDPLDGTREFAAGRREFAVNIGLIRDGAPVLGAVGSPALGEIHYGLVGLGAWRRRGGETVQIHARRPPPEGLTVFASRHYADDPALAALLAQYKVAALTNIGSALKFLRLAEGAADFYPRLGRTMEWDTAAPQAVLEAAGGHVITADGRPLRYGKPGWENSVFYAWGLR